MIDIRTQIIILADKRVNDWFNAQCNDTFGAFYLYHRIGDFIISKDLPDKRYTASSSERISPSWTKNQAKSYVIDVMKNASILPLEVT